MRLHNVSSMILAAAVVLAANGAMAEMFGSGANQFTIDFVTISGSTNPSGVYGKVSKDYRMGIYEITNDQWNKFKVAYGAVNGSPVTAYDTPPTYTGLSVPTNNVSWYEAAQFVNWLNTSTSHHAAYNFTGTQGTSSYTLATWSTGEADGTNLYRHKDAYYYLPTENEWVKAAYWNGTTLQAYATKNNTIPTHGTGTNGGWNYVIDDEDPISPWKVGSGTQELNGTYDMMGNVREWMESPYGTSYTTNAVRGVRGGAFDDYYYDKLPSSSRSGSGPESQLAYLGFRVASEIVPEPGSLIMLAGIALTALLYWWRKRS